MTDESPTTAASARLDPIPGEWRGVSPKYIVVDLVGNLIGGIVSVVVASFSIWLLHWGVWGWVITIAVAAVMIVLMRRILRSER